MIIITIITIITASLCLSNASYEYRDSNSVILESDPSYCSEYHTAVLLFSLPE
jgi:hypothetical protein